MIFATTPEAQQEQYKQLGATASNAIGWAEAQQRVHGSIGAGGKVAATLEAGNDLLNHIAYHGVAEIYADNADGDKLRNLINDCLHRIKFER